VKGLYVHIPFCVRKCQYCDFYSLAGRDELSEAYIQAVLCEAKAYAGRSFQTLYLGGGTPSLLGVELLGKLIFGLRKSFDLSGLNEATIEVNPDSVTKELLRAVIQAGIDRISIGVQSLADYELKSAGRIHTADQAVQAIRLVKEAGLASVSADLIVGLPGQTWSTLRKTIEDLIGLNLEHISLYCLSLEEGTPMAINPPEDLPTEDMQVYLFEQAQKFLSLYGFVHYEISNFALPGKECLHNLNYWRGGEYLGLGPAASSHLSGQRFKNRANLDAYIKEPTGQTEGREILNPEAKAAEEAMLRLRLLVEGICLSELDGRFGKNNTATLAGRLERLAEEDLLNFDGIRYTLPPSRVMTSNPILAEVVS
jgi:oxygen-independent coproporphyrinogen III oxidase